LEIAGIKLNIGADFYEFSFPTSYDVDAELLIAKHTPYLKRFIKVYDDPEDFSYFQVLIKAVKYQYMGKSDYSFYKLYYQE